MGMKALTDLVIQNTVGQRKNGTLKGMLFYHLSIDHKKTKNVRLS